MGKIISCALTVMLWTALASASQAGPGQGVVWPKTVQHLIVEHSRTPFTDFDIWRLD